MKGNPESEYDLDCSFILDRAPRKKSRTRSCGHSRYLSREQPAAASTSFSDENYVMILFSEYRIKGLKLTVALIREIQNYLDFKMTNFKPFLLDLSFCQKLFIQLSSWCTFCGRNMGL